MHSLFLHIIICPSPVVYKLYYWSTQLGPHDLINLIQIQLQERFLEPIFTNILINLKQNNCPVTSKTLDQTQRGLFLHLKTESRFLDPVDPLVPLDIMKQNMKWTLVFKTVARTDYIHEMLPGRRSALVYTLHGTLLK